MVNQPLRTAADLLYAPLGDNRASPAAITAELERDHRELADRRNLLLEKAKVAPTVDNDEAERQVTQFLAQMAACVAKAKAAHKIEKAPHLEAGRAVDRFFLDGFERALEAAAAPLRKALGAYKAAKAKAAPQASTEAHGDVGGLSTLRMIKRWRLINMDIVPRKYLALDEAAIRRAVAAGETIAGIEVYEEADVRISR